MAQIRSKECTHGLLIHRISALSDKDSSGPKSVTGWASTLELCFLLSILKLTSLIYNHETSASISLHGAVGSGPRGCAGVAVLCQPRTPPSPRWIGAAGPARRRPRSVSRQRRRGRAGRKQVRRRWCRPRTGASEQIDPRFAQESGWEERWLSGPAAGGDAHGGPVTQNTPTAAWN